MTIINDRVTENFKNPGVTWRGKPFWAWNGRLEKKELLRQIHIMKEMGMGGFFMHSRTGLVTEYLGDEWFDLINACADEAEKLGLEAWLYDEDRWPSGLAGGIVSKHPEFRQKAILLEIDPRGDGENVIAEFKCNVDATSPSRPILLGERGGDTASTLRFSIIEQGTSGFYNGYTYIDTMNRDATEAFLHCTHEKYAAKCGDRLGRSIKGIFTDEPHRGALLDGFSMYMENGEYTVPYTQKLFEEFQSRFGYDLKEKLPELFFQIEGRRISQVKWHYVELLQQLFLENFAVPCKEWCEKHNLILTGHVLHEDNLTSQTAMSGSMMRYYEHMTSPGVDVLGEHNKNYWIVKQLTSAARQTGKKQLLSELYGCTGWQMPFAGHKAVGDWQALLGINVRCHHLSWYTMRGEAKRDYPASILHQSAWHKEYKHIEDYFARFGLVMAQGRPVCDLLVINPVETFWSQVHLGWSKGLGLQDEHLKTLEEKYQTLFIWLLESQIDFDYGDEEMMGRLGAVEDGVLQVGCSKYKTVLISGMETMRSSTVRLLDEFSKAGGRVVVAGEIPKYLDAVEEPNLESRIPKLEKVAFTKDAVCSVAPQPLATVSAPDIFGQLRKTDDGLIFAALNVNRDERRENAIVRIKTDLPIEEWNCETGEISAVETETSNGWKVFKTDFPKGGQKLWVAGNVEQASQPAHGQTRMSVPQEISGPFEYILSEPNICVLDSAEYRIESVAGRGEAGWQPETDVLKIDRAIRSAHGIERRGGEMCQPWFTAQHPVRELCPVELRYSFEIEVIPEWIDLVLEEPENFTVEINGKLLDLRVSNSWIDIAFYRVRIPADFVNLGKNVITLKTRYKENSNLEAIYLLGNFGVLIDGSVRQIVPLIEKINVGDLCSQGFPFYSGVITYQVMLPEEAKYLRLPSIGGACAKVNGQLLGWEPFEADVSNCIDTVDVEIILTRRNTFGPLHDTQDPRPWIGPWCFVTESNEFSPEPVLTPIGLLIAPKVLVRKERK
jgi:hypothetical protein